MVMARRSPPPYMCPQGKVPTPKITSNVSSPSPFKRGRSRSPVNQSSNHYTGGHVRSGSYGFGHSVNKKIQSPYKKKSAPNAPPPPPMFSGSMINNNGIPNQIGINTPFRTPPPPPPRAQTANPGYGDNSTDKKTEKERLKQEKEYEKERIKNEKIAEKERLKLEKAAEKERKKEEKEKNLAQNDIPNIQETIDKMVKENEQKANRLGENTGLFAKLAYALAIASSPNLLGNSNDNYNQQIGGLSGSNELAKPLLFDDKSPIPTDASLANALASNGNANILTNQKQPNQQNSHKVILTAGPEGTEFQVNTYTDGDQRFSSTTTLTDGGFVVTWDSDGQDGDDYGIYAQIYNKDGTKRGAEFQVNTYTDSSQIYPTVTGLNDGGFVATWASWEDGSTWDVYSQIYNSDGTKKGAEFQVNTYTNDGQIDSSTTALQDGGFVVTWNSKYQDGYEYGVYAQIYNADGTTRGGEFQVHTYTEDSQLLPSTVSLLDGGFVVVWQSNGQDNSGYGIYGQMYNADGTKRGTEFLVNTHIDGNQRYPAVASLKDGGFVVTYDSDGPDGSTYGIFAQRYNADGTKRGIEFQVNTYTDAAQHRPSIKDLQDGGFVIGWGDQYQDGSDYGVYGQIYNSDGTKRGTEFQINTYTPNIQDWTSITDLPDGGFIITWESGDQDGSGKGIFGQRFDKDGNKIELVQQTPYIGPQGTEFQVNTNTFGAQEYPSITRLEDGGVAVAWQSDGLDGSGYAISAQIYNEDGTKRGSEFRVNSHVTNDQSKSSVASLKDGGFAITWTSSDDQDGSGDVVYAQIYNADGTNRGSEFQVNTFITNDQNTVSATGLEDGRLVVAWRSLYQDGSVYGVYAQIFNSDGTKSGEEFLVNTNTDNTQTDPSIASLKDGGFVVSYKSYVSDESTWDILAQVFNTDGTKRGGEFLVNTQTINTQTHSSAEGLQNGRFVIVWMSYNADGSNHSVRGQMYNADSTKIGGEFRVNTYEDTQQAWPAISSLEDGRFVAVWMSGRQESGWGIYGQIFDENGVKIGNELHVNTYTDGAQSWPEVAGMKDGGLVITWNSKDQDGSSYGIFGQRFDANGKKIPLIQQTNDNPDKPSFFKKLLEALTGPEAIAGYILPASGLIVGCVYRKKIQKYLKCEGGTAVGINREEEKGENRVKPTQSKDNIQEIV